MEWAAVVVGQSENEDLDHNEVPCKYWESVACCVEARADTEYYLEGRRRVEEGGKEEVAVAVAVATVVVAVAAIVAE